MSEVGIKDERILNLITHLLRIRKDGSHRSPNIINRDRLILQLLIPIRRYTLYIERPIEVLHKPHGSDESRHEGLFLDVLLGRLVTLDTAQRSGAQS